MMQAFDSFELSTLDQVMDRSPLAVTPQTTVREVITLMHQQRDDRCTLNGLNPSTALEQRLQASSCALVLESERLVGIFTERDIVRLTASGMDLSTVTMGKVMTRSLITLTQAADQNVFTVLSLLRHHRIRHIPILNEQEHLVGVVTLASLQKVLQLATLLKIRRVDDVMTQQVIHAPLTTTVLRVAQLMAEHRISCVVIVESESEAPATDSLGVLPANGFKPIGIITERDIVQFRFLELNLAQTQAQAVMSTPLFCLRPADSLWFAHQEMQRRYARRLVVAGEQGELRGILTQTNLLQVVDPIEMSGVIDVLQHQVEERTQEIQQVNHQLQHEVAQRQQTEAALRLAQEDLERRVGQRTAELSEANLRLRQEIAERKQVEVALRNSQDQLQSILDYSPAVIYLLDSEDRHLLVNRKYAELLSTSPGTLIGKSIYDVWPTSTANAFAANNQQVWVNNQLVQTEEVVPQSDGLHTYITLKFPLSDAMGAPYAICGISTDITQKKQLEQLFYRSQRLESLGTLASGIAHDLNNVFTPILAIAQLMQWKQPNLEERSQEMLQVLQESAKRGADMVKQILSFTRGTGGTRTPVQVDSLLQEVAKVTQQTFPKTIEIRAKIPAQSPGLVSADSTQLHQVLMNLCVNARDAMPDGGLLTLSLENVYVDETVAQMNLDAQAGNYVLVTVSDTGTGIPSEHLDRMFEPFFTTKALGQGTGLGLSTVLGIVKNHDGFIQVVSEMGKGTQFKVYLPTLAKSTIQPTNEDDLCQGNGEWILIVDDEAMILQTTATTLESYSYTPLVASGGHEAIALYTQHQENIKGILIDMMMPNQDGATTIRALRTINPQAHIIATSGLPANRQQALLAGAKAFLPKPYTTLDLLRAFHELLSSSTGSGD